MGRIEFVDLINRAGYSLPYATLTRWTKQVEVGGDVVTGEENRGRKKQLSVKKEHIVAGFIYERMQKNKKTTLFTVREFILSEFCVELSESSVCRLLKSLGFHSRKMQNCSSGYKLDNDTINNLAWNWLINNHEHFCCETLWSIDCFFTGHRTDTHYSFSPRGGPPPLHSGGRSKYTACGVTCVRGDGGYFPTIIYTCNPQFNRNVNPTKRRTEIWKRIDSLLLEYKVNPFQVQFFPVGNKKNPSCVPATSGLVERFLGEYQIPPNSVILSDGGKEFSTLTSNCGFSKHIVYPSPVHQLLSPNDNRLHGAAKQKWRHLGVDFEDDIESLISLVAAINEECPKSQVYFEKNLQLDLLYPSRSRLEDLISGSSYEKFFYKSCLELYKQHLTTINSN